LAKKKQIDQRPTTFWLALAKVVDSLLEKFGWPGLIVLFIMYMVEFRATDEQRHALIDMYLLGRGIKAVYPIMIMGGLFLAASLAQHHLYKRKENLMLAELARIGGEKSSQQEAALGVKLHHSPERSG
jgi:hypothetical protein